MDEETLKDFGSLFLKTGSDVYVNSKRFIAETSTSTREIH
jgi:hypothetical protein